VGQVVVLGNDALRSETLIAYELGYRFRHGENFSIDLATFVNDYGRLTTLEPKPPVDVPGDPEGWLLPQVAENRAEALAWGVEGSAAWRPTPIWRLVLSYAHLEVDVEAAGSLDPQATDREGYAPRRQLDLHSWLDLPGGFELDASLYLVDALPTRNVPSYARLDAMLGWRPAPRFELRVGIQNALRSRHAEVSGPISGAADTQVPRSIWARASWGF
jgi:iron complex outermembrane receptor protein